MDEIETLKAEIETLKAARGNDAAMYENAAANILAAVSAAANVQTKEWSEIVGTIMGMVQDTKHLAERNEKLHASVVALKRERDEAKAHAAELAAQFEKVPGLPEGWAAYRESLKHSDMLYVDLRNAIGKQMPSYGDWPSAIEAVRATVAELEEERRKHLICQQSNQDKRTALDEIAKTFEVSYSSPVELSRIVAVGVKNLTAKLQEAKTVAAGQSVDVRNTRELCEALGEEPQPYPGDKQSEEFRVTKADWDYDRWHSALDDVRLLRKDLVAYKEAIARIAKAVRSTTAPMFAAQIAWDVEELAKNLDCQQRALESQQQELDRRRARRGYIEQELGKASLTLAEASSIIATLLENVKK